MKTWLIVVVIVALMANALILGLFISRPVRHAIPRMPFPPAPPGVSQDILPDLRDHFFHSRDSLRKHMRQLRTNLAEEIASDNTDKAVVDSLLSAISDEQRELQESIIAYIDSLKGIIPEEEKSQLYDWIMEHFGQMRSEKREHRRPPRSHETPKPETVPQSSEY